MAKNSETFISASAPGEVLERFRVLSAEKGWKVKSEDETSVEASQGITWKAWGEHIDISVAETDQGTNVHLVVSTKGGQLLDWGEGSELRSEIRSRLGG